MHLTLYTEKTVAQCLSALNERMHLKGTTAHPALDGWLEKSGGFSVGVSSLVVGRFTRTTYLRGRLERLNGHTVVHGSVSGGASYKDKLVIFAALALIALVLILRGSLTVALVVIPVGAVLYIPLTGDYQNSEILIDELKKTFKARATPPKAVKKGADSKVPARRVGAGRSTFGIADDPDDLDGDP